MATLATFFRRTDMAALDRAETAARAEADPWELRALPNEDVYFYSKRIDNRVVRQANSQERSQCWNAIGGVALAAALLTSVSVPSIGRVIASYQERALEAEHQRLWNERRVLEVEEAALRSPARLEELARRRNLTQPSSSQIIHLNPASDGSLALHK